MKTSEIIENKAQTLDVITHLMCAKGLSTIDIIEHFKTWPVESQFDLAVKGDDDKIVRMPFVTDIDKQKIVGICPFKDSDCYLELKEDYLRRDQCREQDFPTLKFCERVGKIRYLLNNTLALLKDASFEAQPIDGIYHANPDVPMPSNVIENMVVEMNDKTPCRYTRVTPGTPAKVRYVGVIKHE